MTIRKQWLAGALATSMMGLAACGGGSTGSQDVGDAGKQSDSQSRVLYARAVDGYLAGASVYVDLNDNRKLDAFEPRAITDSDGFFSYNHITDTDYCAANAATLSQYCLRASIDADAEVIIRVTGGYDTITGLPFKSVMSLRSSDLDRDDLRLVTPQTSLIADSKELTTQEKFDALIAAGVLAPNGSFDDDHIGDSLSEQSSRAQMATILARLLGTSAAMATGTTFEDVESDYWYASYAVMAKALGANVAAGGEGTFSQVFSSRGALEDLMRRVAYSVLSPGQTMPQSYTLPNEFAAAALLQSVLQVNQLTEELVASTQGQVLTAAEQRAALRVQAIAFERALQNPADPEVSDLIAWTRNQLAQGNGLGSDLTALGEGNVDLSALIDAQFDIDPLSNSISASAVVPAEAADTFASLVNTGFDVEVNKEDQRGAALIYFTGENGARAGELKICVRYRDNEGDFDTGSSSDPNGAMLLSGRWSLINGYTLTMDVNIVGGVQSMLLKSVGVEGLERKYRFDFGDDLSEWTGAAPAGFAVGAVPADDAACKTSLIERFGSLD